MTISGPFIRRPVATTLLAAALLLAGMLAYKSLPVSPLPKVDFPTISVSAALPGASPETMASAVATPLERRFGRIAGITEITSSSSLGQTSITLQFDLSRDADGAARDVQAAIAAAAGELPPNLPSNPTYRRVNPADSPIMIVSATSRTIPLASVFEQANTILAQKISQVPGVGQVSVGGGQQPAVRVRVDPMALAGSGLSYEDVRAAVTGSTADLPKGTFASAQMARTMGANDQLTTAAGFKELVIASHDGAIVKLKDVAEVTDSVENEHVAAWESGVRAVLLIVRRQPGANILETNARVRALLPTLAASISPDIKITLAIDRTQSIQASVNDTTRALVIAVMLVIAVVFVFLRSVRATSIPSVAVPLSLVGTFAVMYLADFSIDNLSLMALTISTGFVVDDAIVVTENITRYVDRGVPPLEAALEGAKQIGFTIISITVSLLAVFIPLLFMGGIVGRLFREFAVTLAIAVALSALISLTLTPMMSARLLTRDTAQHGRLYHFSERCFDGMLHLYDAGLKWALRHRRIMQVLTLASIAVSVGLFIALPKGLFPQEDAGLLMGFTEGPQDISFAAMKARTEQVNAIIKQDPDVDRSVGFIPGFGGGGMNAGTMFISLRPKPARKLSADEVLGRLRGKLSKLDGIKVYLQSFQDMRVGGRSTRTQYQYTLEGADLEELRAYAPKMLEALQKEPVLKDVASDQQTAGLELRIDVDRDSASRLGLTAQTIDDTLYDAYGQRQVALIYSPLNQYRVVLDVKPDYQDPAALQGMYFSTPAHSLVALGSIAKISQHRTSLAVTHQGQFPSVTLSFNVAEGKALGDAVNAIRRVEAEVGLPASVHGDFSGTAQVFMSSLATEPILILFALGVVYIVLGVLYESWVHPITILSTLPSAGVGALLALMITGNELSVMALIGIVLLIGIVKKNAIMMVDFAIEAERERKLGPEEAIHEACLLRFRPIMMTTLAAMLGALPLAFGTGMGSELRRPLGIAIIGGLIVSQMLTLFTTPIIYLTMDPRREAPEGTGTIRSAPSG